MVSVAASPKVRLPEIVVLPVTVRLPPTDTFPVAVIVAILRPPEKNPSLNLAPVDPTSKVFVVLGTTFEEETITSCAGPTLVIGAPSPEVPSCLCPDDALNPASRALYSASKSSASITFPLAMLLPVS